MYILACSQTLKTVWSCAPSTAVRSYCDPFDQLTHCAPLSTFWFQVTTPRVQTPSPPPGSSASTRLERAAAAVAAVTASAPSTSSLSSSWLPMSLWPKAKEQQVWRAPYSIKHTHTHTHTHARARTHTHTHARARARTHTHTPHLRSATSCRAVVSQNPTDSLCPHSTCVASIPHACDYYIRPL
jgi:hypothetical protein